MHPHERVKQENCDEQNAGWAGKKHRKIRKNNNFPFPPLFELACESPFIHLCSIITSWVAVSMGLAQRGLHTKALAKIYCQSEKKQLFSVHTFFSLQHRSGRGDIMRQAIAQAKATICQCPAGRHRAQVNSGVFRRWLKREGYSWLPQPPHSHTPIPMGWFVLVYSNSPFA